MSCKTIKKLTCSDLRNNKNKYTLAELEENIDNYDKLKSVADKGFEYFDKYSRPDYIIDLL